MIIDKDDDDDDKDDDDNDRPADGRAAEQGRPSTGVKLSRLTPEQTAASHEERDADYDNQSGD